MRWLLLLLCIPLISASTSFSVTTPIHDGFTVTPVISVWDQGALATHQNLGFEVLRGDEVLFGTSSLHEHDGLATLLYTVPDHPIQYRIRGDETILLDGEVIPTAPPKPPSLHSMEGTTLELEGDVLRFHKQDDKGIRGQYVMRDADGIVLSGWMAGHGFPTLDLATVHADSEIRAEMFLVGRVGAREISATGLTQPAMSELRTVESLNVPECTDLIMDPQEAVAGNAMRVVKADEARLTDQPREHRVDFQLRSIDNLLQESILYDWLSAGPMAQTSFRIPSAGDFKLIVTEQEVACQVEFSAVSGSSETAELETEWTYENGTLTGHANVDNDVHYEYPMELRFLNNGTEGSKLVFAGKLHSHGNGVNFAAKLPPGTYEWIVDVDAQGADPIIKTGLQGHREILVLEAPKIEEREEAPVGFGLLVLGLIVLGTSRR